MRNQFEDVQKNIERIVDELFHSFNGNFSLTPRVYEAFFNLNNVYGVVKCSQVNESTINETKKRLFKAKVLSNNTIKYYAEQHRKRFTSYKGKDKKKDRKEIELIFTEVILNGQEPLKIKDEGLIKVVAEAIAAYVNIQSEPPIKVTPTQTLSKVLPAVIHLKSFGISSLVIAEFLNEIGFVTATASAIDKAIQRARQTPPKD